MKNILFILICILIYTNKVQAQARALNFDGNDDKVELGNWFNYQVFSIEMWIKPGATQNAYANIIDNNHEYAKNWVCQQDGNNTNHYYFGIKTGVASFQLTADIWQHIAIVKDENEIRVYVDGSLIDTEPHPDPVDYSAPAPSLRLGDWGSSGRTWNGSIDELRIWDRAISQTEINSKRHCELLGTQIGLLAYYKFNQGVVNGNNPNELSLADETGSHNGTLNNFALSGSSSNFTHGSVNALCPPIIFSDKSKACLGEIIKLRATGCGGTVVWSDGASGTYRPVLFNSTTILTAVCTNGSKTSSQSNLLQINIVPLPVLVITNPMPVTYPTTIDLTSSNVTIGSVLPTGTTLSFFKDASCTIILPNPLSVTLTGTYYIKATNDVVCTAIMPVLAEITNCSQPIDLISNSDNLYTGTLLRKTNESITASNIISGSAKTTYRSNKSITLIPQNGGGFIAENGTVFLAEIGGCN